jgi:chromosome partitioning protein
MIITMAATKGGASKTTTAVCLALEAHEQGRDVTLVDLDPQGAGAKWAHELGVAAPHVRNASDVRTACGNHAVAFVDTPPGADPRTVGGKQAPPRVKVPTRHRAGDNPGLMEGKTKVGAGMKFWKRD